MIKGAASLMFSMRMLFTSTVICIKKQVMACPRDVAEGRSAPGSYPSSIEQKKKTFSHKTLKASFTGAFLTFSLTPALMNPTCHPQGAAHGKVWKQLFEKTHDHLGASSTDVKPRWRNWDEDYAMGYQRHP